MTPEQRQEIIDALCKSLGCTEDELSDRMKQAANKEVNFMPLITPLKGSIPRKAPT